MSGRHRSWIVGALFGITGAGVTPADCQEAQLFDLLEKVRIEAEAPGAILGVQVGQGPAILLSVGHADLEGERRLSSDQPFFLGSASKIYTAAVLMRLAEQGLLSIDDSLQRWLPDFPRAQEISLRQLLGHTSGLKDLYSYIYYRPDREEMVALVRRSWSEAELLELAGRFGHWFDPGTDWSYSSTNYYLLGVVIERASGLTLAEAYRLYIYSPLGINRTWLAWHEDGSSALTPGFMGPVEGWVHSEMFGSLGATTRLDRSPVEWGAGGIAAPAAEALRFIGSLMRGSLLSASSLGAMTEFRPTPPLGIAGRSNSGSEADNGYGLGLVRMVRNGFTLVGHGGLFTGHTAGVWFVQECDAAIAVYFNRGFVGQRDLLDGVTALLAEGAVGAWECGLTGEAVGD